MAGTYSPQDGTIEGTLTGKKLSFQWTQAGGYKGNGFLKMNAEGRLNGVFTIVEGPKKVETECGPLATEAPKSMP